MNWQSVEDPLLGRGVRQVRECACPLAPWIDDSPPHAQRGHAPWLPWRGSRQERTTALQEASRSPEREG